ncbi:MAG: hypothetical protein P9M14_04975 [Candidatus Alcyoniella australis]|nr:hypothetical protein [Candidatus Alcyoniella australis]
MTQIRTFDYKEERRTLFLNRHLKGLMLPGFHSGFGVQAGSSGKLTITAGVMCTRDGVRIEETEDLADCLDIEANSSGEVRCDRIVLRHEFQEAYPALPATYEILQGTPGANAPPSEPSDGYTLAVGYIMPGQSDYGSIISSGRFQENFRYIEIGSGRYGTNDSYETPELLAADYNGWDGLLRAIDDLRDETVFVRLVGTIDIHGTLEVPAGWAVDASAGWIAADSGVSPAVDLLSWAGSGQVTQETGEYYIEDTGHELSKLSKLALLIIEGGGNTAYCNIAERVSSTKGRLSVQSCSPEMPTGEVTYKALASARWEGGTIIAAEGGDGLHADYLQNGPIRRLFCACAGSGGQAISSEGAGYDAVIDGCKVQGSWSKAIAVDNWQGGRVVNNDCSTREILIGQNCTDVLVKGNTGNTKLYGQGCGDFSKPFSQEHSLAGVHDQHQEYAYVRTGVVVLEPLVAQALAEQKVVRLPLGRGASFAEGDIVWLRGNATAGSAEFNRVDSITPGEGEIEYDEITLVDDLQWTKDYTQGGPYSIIARVKRLDLLLDGRDRLVGCRGVVRPQEHANTLEDALTRLPGGENDSEMHAWLEPAGSSGVDIKARSVRYAACQVYAADGVHPVGVDARPSLDSWGVLHDDNWVLTLDPAYNPQGRLFVANADVTIGGETAIGAGELLITGIGWETEDLDNYRGLMPYILTITLSPILGGGYV